MVYAETSPLIAFDWDKVAREAESVPALLAHCAERYFDLELLVQDGSRISYGEAIAAANRLSAQLMAFGIAKGARVGILLPNGPQWLISWIAIVQIGAVAVPISTLSTGFELRHILSSSGLSLLIVTDGYLGRDFNAVVAEALDLPPAGASLPVEQAPFLRAVWTWADSSPPWAFRIGGNLAAVPLDLVGRAAQTVHPSDPVSIIYTSGTTTQAKGVIHSHGNFVRSARRNAAALGYRTGDRVFEVRPFFWVGGIVVNVLTIMEVGATLVGSARRQGLADLIADEKITIIATTGAVSQAIRDEIASCKRDLSAVRAGSIQELVPPEKRVLNQRFYGAALGMTETAGPHTMPIITSIADDYAGSMGPTAPGMEHRVIDPQTGTDVAAGTPGELLVRGDGLMMGYVGRDREQTFDADGWFHTGDICSFRGGHLFFHGRKDAQIKTSGANVSPAEVEAVLCAIPGVEAAFVCGLSDRQRGQIVAALVVRSAGTDLTENRLLEEARRMLSSYKVPRRVRFVEALPVTATGKVNHRDARSILEADGPA